MLTQVSWGKVASILAVLTTLSIVAGAVVSYQAKNEAEVVVAAHTAVHAEKHDLEADSLSTQREGHAELHESELRLEELRTDAVLQRLDLLDTRLQGLWELSIQEMARDHARGD